MEKIDQILESLYDRVIEPVEAKEQLLLLFDVNRSCSCGVKYVKTKKSDIPYDTDDNVYYTDIIIYHCPKCGNIDRIEEY